VRVAISQILQAISAASVSCSPSWTVEQTPATNYRAEYLRGGLNSEDSVVNGQSLSDWNDAHGRDFNAIADMIEAEL
jgi:hypothetical protein